MNFDFLDVRTHPWSNGKTSASQADYPGSNPGGGISTELSFSRSSYNFPQKCKIGFQLVTQPWIVKNGCGVIHRDDIKCSVVQDNFLQFSMQRSYALNSFHFIRTESAEDKFCGEISERHYYPRFYYFHLFNEVRCVCAYLIMTGIPVFRRAVFEDIRYVDVIERKSY